MNDSKFLRELALRHNKNASASIDINQEYGQNSPFIANGPHSMQTAPTIEPTYDEHGSQSMYNSISKQYLTPYQLIPGN
jgi:hypothetical protein